MVRRSNRSGKKSGRHPPGSRSRRNGGKEKSNWDKTTKAQLDAMEDRTSWKQMAIVALQFLMFRRVLVFVFLFRTQARRFFQLVNTSLGATSQVT